MRPLEGRKKRFGDRKDGYRVRSLDPMSMVSPYIMRNKSDSWVLFEDSIDITKAQEFLQKERKAGWKGLTTYHLLFSALVRTISQIPQLNRFVQGSRVYARNEVKFAMVVKKGMHFDGDRTIITPRFQLEDTLRDVYDRVEEEVGKIDRTVKVVDDQNKTGFDGLETALSMIPGFLLRFVFFMIRFLDRHGWLPKKLTDLSPFHTSCFITNMGSMGLGSIFHHVYELGTLSIFIALGKKYNVNEINRDGNVVSKTYIDVKVVADERITDGFVYASAFKEIRSYMMHPETLMSPPEEIKQDQVDRVRRKN